MTSSRDAAPVGALTAEGLISGYGDLRVLREVSITLMPGKVEVALGRNGVGKTTLLSTLAGLLPLWSGSIRLDEKEIGRQTPYARARLGLALVQTKRVFQRLTVTENLTLGTFAVEMSRKQREVRAAEMLVEFPQLRGREKQRAGELSGGQQQMLAIAQALAGRPRVLILDEPSAGLAPSIVGDVFQKISTLRDGGMTVLLAEQLAGQALTIADHVSVLNGGQIVASGPPSEFYDLSRLEEAYFGDPGEEPKRSDVGSKQ